MSKPRASARSARAARAARQGVLLSDWLAGAARRRVGGNALDGGERLQVIDTFITVLGGAYCHLPQKRAAYAADPVQALHLLRRRAVELSEAEFHLAITSIVQGLRDAHTQYSGPRSLGGAVAVLPFLIEQYGPVSAPKLIVSKVSDPSLIGDKRFKAGVSLTTWNGVPFERALELHADRETGGRPDARRARALESLTFRSLESGPPPDELHVDVGFVTERGAKAEVRIPWRVITPGAAPDGHRPGSRASRFMAVSPAREHARRAKKLLFSGELWQAEARRGGAQRAEGWLETDLQDVLAARPLSIRGVGEFGYLRVWTFDVNDADTFLDEVVRLLARLPDGGLIVDVRGNPGGLIWAAERMLQLFTPHPIVPTGFSLVATPLTRAMAANPLNRLELQAWESSLEQAILTGEAYSQPLPLTDPAWCNDLGQHYSGPVVCVVDANTYSSGDLFAAGFVDNAIGPLVTVGEATGAGGANVWTSTDMREALANTPHALEALPDGVTYTVAIRRAVRAREANGLPIEDVGVAGIPYVMTRRDLVEDNRDLLLACAKLLAGVERTAMRVERHGTTVRVETHGVEELEIYFQGRPLEGVRRLDAPAAGLVVLEDIAADGELEIVGRRGGAVVQRRRLRAQP